ncbi:amidase [Sinorhizobium meliloti]|uniref:amidase n=1 Tax=Rhizobium meliloti TaxID=382 RepID=UPI001297E713|nr:amidase [Sinorhizobium meliloti]MQX90998.1 amidase [Sinorhizobium meliloti]
MKVSDYVKHDAVGLGSLVNTGEVTRRELIQAARAAYDDINPQINAVIEFYEDVEDGSGAGFGPFNGVPFFRKDIGPAEAGRLQERGSRLFRAHRTEVESYFFCRARNGGLCTLGRTALPEFGTSGTSESLLHGITRNPWNLSRSSGGSSSGSAAAVAAGITPIAHASDGGGSIRVPAAWCGLVGLNPSPGRIPGGAEAQDASFGITRQFVLCRSVRDMAAALDVFSPPHAGDPFIIIQPDRPYLDQLLQRTGKLRVGVARSKWGAVKPDQEIISCLEATATKLEEMGHSIRDMQPPYVASDYVRILLGRSMLNAPLLEEAARQLGREINGDTLEPINLKIHELCRNARPYDPRQLIEDLRKMQFDVGAAIDQFDILLTPTMPIVAPPHGNSYCTTNPALSAEEYLEADAALYQFLGVFNVTGHPSLSLPLGQSIEGLPIGIQVVGRFGDEATLVRVARDLEEAMPWVHRRPGVLANG